MQCIYENFMMRAEIEDESGADREKGAKQLKRRRKYETAKTTQSAVHEGGGTYNHRYADGVNRR